MKRPLSTLIFVISWFAFSILSILVDSHSQSQNGANSPPSPLNRSQDPSPPLTPPSPSPPPPPILSPPPPPFSRPRRPPRRSPPFPVPRNNINNNRGSKFKRSHDKGKIVGLLFVGIAAVLQICVVGFLVFKRRQLLRSKDRYDGLS